MNGLLQIARKELRHVFHSPTALLFFGAFALVTLFTFFTSARFFARNLADVRPLFEWLPLLLAFLTASITMRMWAEERRTGTMELLVTLPVPTVSLVLGKFIAGVGLVGLALVLTVPLPLMVASLGSLDVGPVVGGYVGALCLGAFHVALGLAISARTENQVVALMATLGVAMVLYLIGAPAVTALAPTSVAEVLRAFSTGARFESIERGVIDARDLVWYLSGTTAFLLFNIQALEHDRVDRGSDRGRASARGLRVFAALLVANLVVLNGWLAPVRVLRVDLTAHGEYSVSDVTRTTLRALREPLVIEGYFSERSHPLLAPLVPQIRDLLAEYAVISDRVRVDFQDPGRDEELADRIQQDYGIQSVPLRVADRTQQAVVNAWFHIVVRYGDQHEVLGIDDVIDVRADSDGVQVRLRNLEYDVTRAIRRVTRDFQSLETMLASLASPARLTAWVTPSTLPAEFQEAADRVRRVAEELQAMGAFEFHEVDPSGRPDLQQQLAREYGIAPLATDLFATSTFYFDLVLEADGRRERIVPRGELSEGDVRRAIEAAIRRAVPGQLVTVGLFTNVPDAPDFDPSIPPQYQQRAQRPPDLRFFEQRIAQTHSVRRVDLSGGEVPSDIDVLVVAKPGTLTEEESFALDQYLMRGGALVVFAGRRTVTFDGETLQSTPVDDRLFELLSTWGVTVQEQLVLDEQNAVFPVPVVEQRGNLRLRRIEMVPYAPFPDVRPDAYVGEHPALAGVTNFTVPWGSPLQLRAPEGVQAEALARTSSSSRLGPLSSVQPDFRRHPRTGFPETGEGAPYVVAATLHGTFPSAFARRPSPLFAADDETADETADRTGRTIKTSSPRARLAVVGSQEAISDLLLMLANEPGGEVHLGNLQLAENLIDWAVEDTDLLSIRNGGAFARTLRPLTPAQQRAWELGHVAFAGVVLLVLAFIPVARRRRVVSFADRMRAAPPTVQHPPSSPPTQPQPKEAA
jgi:ABC-2 type transport system permease protein